MIGPATSTKVVAKISDFKFAKAAHNFRFPSVGKSNLGLSERHLLSPLYNANLPRGTTVKVSRSQSCKVQRKSCANIGAKMGALKYVEELHKKKQSDVLRFLLRVRCWEVSLP